MASDLPSLISAIDIRSIASAIASVVVYHCTVRIWRIRTSGSTDNARIAAEARRDAAQAERDMAADAVHARAEESATDKLFIVMGEQIARMQAELADCREHHEECQGALRFFSIWAAKMDPSIKIDPVSGWVQWGVNTRSAASPKLKGGGSGGHA